MLDLSLSQTGALELTENITALRSDLPAVKVDGRLFSEVVDAIKDVMESDGDPCEENYSVTTEGLCLTLTSSQPHWTASLNRQDPGFSLAERLLLMEGGTFTLVGNMVKMLFPWPALQDTDVAIRKSGDICFVGEKSEKVPTMLPFVRFLDIQSVIKDMKSLEPYAAMALDAEKASFSMHCLSVRWKRMRRRERCPFFVFIVPKDLTNFPMH